MLDHWIISKDRAAMITTNLDRNLMTVKAAKDYFWAYGVSIKGRTKQQFIKNLWQLVLENEGEDNGD